MELSVLLDRYGLDERSDFVERLSEETDEEIFWFTVSGLELWGGSGAVWEVGPFEYRPGATEAAVPDTRRFQQLMIDLADILEARGLGALAVPNADYFRTRLDKGGA